MAPGFAQVKHHSVLSIRLCMLAWFIVHACPSQRGPMEVMDVLAERISKEHSGDHTSHSKLANMFRRYLSYLSLGPFHALEPTSSLPPSFADHRVSVDFLMGCHATPFYTHLHLHPLPKLRFLDCTPPRYPLLASMYVPWHAIV